MAQGEAWHTDKVYFAFRHEFFSETGLPVFTLLGNSVGMNRAGAVRPRLCCGSTTGASNTAPTNRPAPCAWTYVRNRAATNSKMPSVPTFQTSERITGTPAA